MLLTSPLLPFDIFKKEIHSRNLLQKKNEDNQSENTDKCYFRLQEGKKVLEILPAKFNKSNVVSYLIDEYPKSFPVYFGDDYSFYYYFCVVCASFSAS